MWSCRRDGVAGQFNLGEDFDDATQQNEPEEAEVGFRTGAGGGDEFAGAHDGSGQDHAGTQVHEDALQVRGRGECAVAFLFVF